MQIEFRGDGGLYITSNRNWLKLEENIQLTQQSALWAGMEKDLIVYVSDAPNIPFLSFSTLPTAVPASPQASLGVPRCFPTAPTPPGLCSRKESIALMNVLYLFLNQMYHQGGSEHEFSPGLTSHFDS
jgi:hypothetical protein